MSRYHEVWPRLQAIAMATDQKISSRQKGRKPLKIGDQTNFQALKTMQKNVRPRGGAVLGVNNRFFCFLFKNHRAQFFWRPKISWVSNFQSSKIFLSRADFQLGSPNYSLQVNLNHTRRQSYICFDSYILKQSFKYRRQKTPLQAITNSL